MSPGRVTLLRGGAGVAAVIREKSERMEYLCTHTEAEFSAQRCTDTPSPASPRRTFALTPASYYLSSDAQQAPNCFSWLSLSSLPGSQCGGVCPIPSFPARWELAGSCLQGRQRQQPFVPAPAGCIDMLSIEGQFTFTAERPQLHCATFFIGEPEELIAIHYDFVNIDCQGGDFLKVRSCEFLLSSDLCLLCVQGAGERVCTSVCVCVYRTGFHKAATPGMALSPPEAPECVSPLPRYPSSKAKSEDPSPDYSTGSSELFQKHLYGGSTPGGMAEYLLSKIFSLHCESHEPCR